MAVTSFAEFGWTLADIFNPKHSKLHHLRSNMLNCESKYSTGKHAPRSDIAVWDSISNLLNDQTMVSSFRPKRERQESQTSSVDSGHGSEEASSIADETISSEESYCDYSPVLERHSWRGFQQAKPPEWNCVGQNEKLRKALETVETRKHQVSSVFQELKEIRDDLAQMNDRMDQTTDNLRQAKHLRVSGPPIYRPMSEHLSGSSQDRGPSSDKKRKLILDEDEMVDITHRVLKRVCQLTLARAEGQFEVSLII